MFKNKFSQIITFFLFLIITIILFKKFNKYYSQNDFAKLLILFILLLNFFLGFLIRKFTKISLIFFGYFILILYSVNGLLLFFNIQNTPQKKIEKVLEKENKIFDKRSIIEVVKDERSKNVEIYPQVVPREFLKKNIKKIPLTPMANTLFVSCNEFGEWKKIKTDKLGLNNEKFIDTFDILLMGDSFAEGSCVNQSDEPTNLLNQNYNLKTYSIGISGNGPLLSLALAHEIKPLIDFHTIIWLIFDNDFYDINLEIQSGFLKNYLIKNFDNNEYFQNIDEAYKFQKKYIEDNLESLKKGFSFKESFFELKAVISRINKLIHRNNPEDTFVFQRKLFENIFEKLTFIYPEKKIYVVYLPETTCFKHRSLQCSKRFEELSQTSNNLNFLNFYEHLKNNNDEYKKMYALGQDRAHFSPLGYSELVKFILSESQKD